jgi:hypothetical protein
VREDKDNRSHLQVDGIKEAESHGGDSFKHWQFEYFEGSNQRSSNPVRSRSRVIVDADKRRPILHPSARVIFQQRLIQNQTQDRSLHKPPIPIVKPQIRPSDPLFHPKSMDNANHHEDKLQQRSNSSANLTGNG